MTAADGRAALPVPGFLGRVLDDDGSPAGTCFQAAPSLLVTAWHVLDDLGRAATGAVVRVDLLSGGDTFAAHVLATDPAHDLAVLRAAREFPATVAGFAASDTVPPGTEVSVVAAGRVDDHDHTYRFLTAIGTWQGTTVRDDLVALGRFRSADVLPGMSGAPVCLGSAGPVAGVLSGRYNSADGWLTHSVWAGRAEYLVELLDPVLAITLLDVSSAAVAWRARRTGFRKAMAHLAREQRDAFLVGNCGPPFVPAFVRPATAGSPDAPRLPAAEVLATAETGVWLVGGPGSGKSRLLRAWTLELALETPATRRVPVLVRAGDLAAALGSPAGPVSPVESLAAAVGAGLGSVGHGLVAHGPADLAEWFTAGPADVEWVVLVDGLDEVADERLRARVFTLVARLSEDPAWRCRVVVASRPAVEDDPGRTGWRHARFDLLELDDAGRDELVRGWFPELGLTDPGQADAFVADLHRRGLHRLTRIPLMLVILGQLYAWHLNRTLPASRVEAYERIVEETHRRRTRASGVTGELHDWHDEHLAGAVDELSERLGGVDGLLARLAFERFRGTAESAVDWIAEQTQDLRGTTRLSPEHWRAVVREALRDSRLLVARRGDFEFVHASLYEFFAARHLARDNGLSTELLHLVFGRYGKRFNDESGYWSLGDPWFRSHVPFLDWVFACWADWPPFTAMLHRFVARHDVAGCVYVASLASRWVRLDPGVLVAARAKLAAKPAGSDAETVVQVAHRLAQLGDPAGAAALIEAAGNPLLGFARITAAQKLIAHGDARGLDLLADATEAVVTAPEPGRLTDDEAEARRHAAGDLARRGHPRAGEILERFLRDPRTDDGRTRRYTYSMLSYYVETSAAGHEHAADLLARLWAALPANDAVEAHKRGEDLDWLLRLTDDGCADRLAVVASAAATMRVVNRGKAAVRLAELGDPRAADLLAGVLADFPDGEDEADARLDVAWALARLGDSRAVAAVVDTAGHAKFWRWERQVKETATSRNPAAVDVLADIAAAAGLQSWNRRDPLRWLMLVDHPRGVDLTMRAVADPAMDRSLFALADALARRGDPRFAPLLARWAECLTDQGSHSYEDRRTWAAGVLSAPDRVLGDGLLADDATCRNLDPFGRLLSLADLFHTDHPRAMDCLLAVHREFEARADMTDRHNSSRYHVVNMLAEKGNPLAIPRLAQWVRDTDRTDSERTEALKRLATMDGPVVADTLVALAPDVRWTDRWSLAYKLRAMGDPRAGALLAEWILADLETYPFDPVDWKPRDLHRHGDPHVVTVYEHLVARHFAGGEQHDLGRVVDRVADIPGQRSVDVLARWALDTRFTPDQRIAAFRRLVAADTQRAADVHDRMVAGAGLTPRHHRLLREAVVSERAPRSSLEALFRYAARTSPSGHTVSPE